MRVEVILREGKPLKKPGVVSDSLASQRINEYIGSFPDWRGKTLEAIRKTVLSASPKLAEEWKWGGPVWTSQGLVCAASAFKNHVKINFFRGASLKDPSHLFNAGLDAKTMRSIDFHEGDRVRQTALRAMVRAAVALNAAARAGS
jgi:hypothetical protein